MSSVTKEELNANIASVHYFTAADGVAGSRDGVHLPEDPRSLGLLTFCVLVLRNGFTVTGESACVSPENFNQGIGQRIAYENAWNKIWPLMGYALKDRLWRDSEDAMAFYEAAGT